MNVGILSQQVQLLQATSDALAKAAASLGYQAPAYGPSINIPVDQASYFKISVTDHNNFTINNPTGIPTLGRDVTIAIRRGLAGVLGAITWGSLYRLQNDGVVSLSVGYTTAVTFVWDGSVWTEKSRATNVNN